MERQPGAVQEGAVVGSFSEQCFFAHQPALGLPGQEGCRSRAFHPLHPFFRPLDYKMRL